MEVAALVFVGILAALSNKKTDNADNIEPIEKIDEDNLPISKDIYLGTEQLSPNEIVDDIINGNIPKIDYKDYNYLVTNNPKTGTTFVDKSRELKDIGTEIVVNTFLESSESNFNFLKAVYGMFDESIKYYAAKKELPNKSMFFVYKGGNVLRIISNEFLRELPGLAAYEIAEYYQKFFKRSDADFSIYINPDLENYDNIYSDMVLLSYVLQRKLRSQFQNNPITYFDIYKYTTEYQEKIFQPYFNRIRDANVFKDESSHYYNKKPVKFVFDKATITSDSPIDSPNYNNNIDYIGKKDIGIAFNTKINDSDVKDDSDGKEDNKEDSKEDNKEENNITAKKEKDNKNAVVEHISVFNLNEKLNSIYVQSNETLDFKANGRVKFALVRSKINFNVYAVPIQDPPSYLSDNDLLQIGGELIDVSLPHRLDDKIHHFFENMNDYLHKYELSYKSDLLTFTSYSLLYLIEDLEFILFKFVRKPWEAPKYEKRVNRLFYLYMIDIFNKLKTNEDRETFLNGFSDMIDDLSISVNTDEMNEIINTFRNDYMKMQYLHINNLLDYLIEINNILTPDDLPNYRNFLSVLKENSNIISGSFKNVDQYCSIDGSIRLKNIYDGDLKSLV